MSKDPLSASPQAPARPLWRTALAGALYGALVFLAVYAVALFFVWAGVSYLAGSTARGRPTIGTTSVIAATSFVLLGAVQAVRQEMKRRSGPA